MRFHQARLSLSATLMLDNVDDSARKKFVNDKDYANLTRCPILTENVTSRRLGVDLDEKLAALCPVNQEGDANDPTNAVIQ